MVDKSLVEMYLSMLKAGGVQMKSYNNKRYYARKNKNVERCIAFAIAWECFKCGIDFEGDDD